jgi:nitrite reductase/ring-hydroxylating ferredoxin subunit
MPRYLKVGNRDDLPQGAVKTVQAHRVIAVFHTESGFYTIDDLCPHRGGPLSEGKREGKCVTCPWHGARFDLETGQVLGGPSPKGVSCYAVRLNDNTIEIELPDTATP